MKRTLSGVLLSSILITTINISDTAQAQVTQTPYDTLTIHMAPQDECFDDGDGSIEKPLCDLEAATMKAQSEYQNGNARGDVEIRFKTGVNSAGNIREYTFVEKGESSSKRNFDFSATAGHRVYFLPDWFDRNDPTKVKEGLENYVRIRPADVEVRRPTNEADQENVAVDEKLMGVSISPTKNRGGSYHIEYLDIQGFMSGLTIDNGNMWTDKHESDPVASIHTNGTVRGFSAPINNPIIKNVHYEKIGNIYGDRISPNLGSDGKQVRASDSGNAAQLYRNITNGEFSNITFKEILNENFENKQHLSWGHVVYGMTSTGNHWNNIMIDKTNMSALHSRMENNAIVENTDFIENAPNRLGEFLHIGRWNDWASGDKARFKECSAAPMNILDSNTATWQGNPVEVSTYNTGSGIDGTRPDWAICDSPERMYPVDWLQGVQTGEDSYQLKWGEARTGGTPVTHYEVIAGTYELLSSNLDNSNDTSTVLKTIQAGQPLEVSLTREEIEQAGVDADGDTYLTVIAVNENGNRSARTAMRIAVNLAEDWENNKQIAPVEVFTWDKPNTYVTEEQILPVVEAQYLWQSPAPVVTETEKPTETDTDTPIESETEEPNPTDVEQLPTEDNNPTDIDQTNEPTLTDTTIVETNTVPTQDVEPVEDPSSVQYDTPSEVSTSVSTSNIESVDSDNVNISENASIRDSVRIPSRNDDSVSVSDIENFGNDMLNSMFNNNPLIPNMSGSTITPNNTVSLPQGYLTTIPAQQVVEQGDNHHVKQGPKVNTGGNTTSIFSKIISIFR